MSLLPLFEASTVIQIHVFAAVAAFCLGVVQFLGPKGTLPHRQIGFIWVAVMAIVAASGLLIHEVRWWGPWSPIHILSIYTLVMLPLGIWRARRHDVSGHRSTMTGIFLGGLVIAGLLSLLPDRIMHAVVFGG